MSLDWNHGKVQDHHTLHNTGDDAAPKGSDIDLAGDIAYARTSHIALLTMGVGINRITDRNWQTFAARLEVWQDVHGAPMQRFTEENGIENVRLTPADVHRRIGLSTNASTLTDAAFRKNMIAELERRARRAVNRTRHQVETEGVNA